MEEIRAHNTILLCYSFKCLCFGAFFICLVVRDATNGLVAFLLYFWA